MSQWRCKTDDGELGPVSFQELAELLRAEKVTQSALVRREGAGNWEPAWHVPGLLRAAGMAEAGDSPLVEREDAVAGHAALTPALSRRERENTALPGYVAQAERQPLLTLGNVVRGIVAAAVGMLAAGFFFRWASQAALAFPMPPTVVDGELVDCYFAVVGRCTSLECGLLYLDVFAVAAAATWYAAGKRIDAKP